MMGSSNGSVGVSSRQHYLLHLELRTRSAGDDRFGPLVDRLILFAPVVLFGIPHAQFFEPQRHEAERGHIEPRGFDLAG